MVTEDELKRLCLEVGLDEHDAEVFARMPEIQQIVDHLHTLILQRITRKLTEKLFPSPK